LAPIHGLAAGTQLIHSALRGAAGYEVDALCYKTDAIYKFSGEVCRRAFCEITFLVCYGG
jgi:hypothetical protein